MCFHHSGEIYRVYFLSSCNCKTSHLTLRHPHFILSQMPFSQHGSLTAPFNHVVLQPRCPAPVLSSETDRVSGWEISRACHIHSWSVTVLSTPTLDTMRFVSWIYICSWLLISSWKGFISFPPKSRHLRENPELEAYSLPVLGDLPSGRPWAPPQTDPYVSVMCQPEKNLQV